jgi:mannose-6-phosphate isomerase
MHLEQSMASLEANTARPPQIVRTTDKVAVLAECEEFRITRHRLALGDRLVFAAGKQPRILSLVEGRLEATGTAIQRGANIMLPYAGDFVFSAQEAAIVLITENFNHAK